MAGIGEKVVLISEEKRPNALSLGFFFYEEHGLMDFVFTNDREI